MRMLYVFMKKSANQCTADCYSSLLPRVSLLPVPWALEWEHERLLSEAHLRIF